MSEQESHPPLEHHACSLSARPPHNRLSRPAYALLSHDSLTLAPPHTSTCHPRTHRYDGDGNGDISLSEMTNMIVEMDLQHLGVTKDEIANYVTEEFERADKDASGEISL